MFSRVWSCALVLLCVNAATGIHTRNRHFHTIMQEQQETIKQEVSALVRAAPTEFGTPAGHPTTADVNAQFCLADATSLANALHRTNLDFKTCSQSTFKGLHKDFVTDKKTSPFKGKKPVHWGFLIVDDGTNQFICNAANYNGDGINYVGVGDHGGAVHTEKHCLGEVLKKWVSSKITSVDDVGDLNAKNKLSGAKTISAWLATLGKSGTLTFTFCLQKKMCPSCTAVYTKAKAALVAAGYTMGAEKASPNFDFCSWD